jgi:hypothetical protein
MGIFSQKSQFVRRNNKRVKIFFIFLLGFKGWLEAHVERQLKAEKAGEKCQRSQRFLKFIHILQRKILSKYETHEENTGGEYIHRRILYIHRRRIHSPEENTFTGEEYIHRRENTFTGGEYIHRRRLPSPEENTFTGGENIYRRR